MNEGKNVIFVDVSNAPDISAGSRMQLVDMVTDAKNLVLENTMQFAQGAGCYYIDRTARLAYVVENKFGFCVYDVQQPSGIRHPEQ